MMLTKTELEVVSQIGNGNKEVAGIAKTLGMSASQIYKIGKKLGQKGILCLKDGTLQPEMKTHVNLLLKIMSRAAKLSTPFSGTGLRVFLSLLQPRTVKDVQKETGLHKTTILKKIRQGRKMSLFLIEKSTYRLNEIIWQDVIDYLIELKRYEEVIDARIPANSIIYFKNEKEIVFSNNEKINAEMTAFSAYEKYGIKLFCTTNYYCLPKRHVTKREVFLHSLFVAEKERDTRYIIFAALFLAKYKKRLSKTSHPIVASLLKVLAGEKIQGYPALNEIKDRAGIYNIRV